MGVNSIMAEEIMIPIEQMEPSGRVLPLFRGEYADDVVYEDPDIVLYKNSSYVAKRTTVGNPPPENALSNDYWQMVAKGIIDADVSEAAVKLTYETEEREELQSGENTDTLFSKIKKWLNDLKPVAFSGDYKDLKNSPAIPAAAKNGKLTIQRNGTAVQTFTADQGSDATANILVPTISNSAAVTQTGQMALDAVEKNAAVAGTLANQIAQQNSNLAVQIYDFEANPFMNDVTYTVRDSAWYPQNKIYKFGRVCWLNLGVDTTNVTIANRILKIVTLPDEFAPLSILSADNPAEYNIGFYPGTNYIYFSNRNTEKYPNWSDVTPVGGYAGINFVYISKK